MKMTMTKPKMITVKQCLMGLAVGLTALGALGTSTAAEVTRDAPPVMSNGGRVATWCVSRTCPVDLFAPQPAVKPKIQTDEKPHQKDLARARAVAIRPHQPALQSAGVVVLGPAGCPVVGQVYTAKQTYNSLSNITSVRLRIP